VKASQILRDHGQSLWVDNITRGLLDSGQLQRYIDDYSVTGLTSNPSIFDKAVASGDYDDAIRERSRTGRSDEALFLELAIGDLRRAADAFLPIHERTDGVDGWVSLEVSPLLARDTAATIDAAKSLHAGVARRNLFIKIPGTAEGLPAITECIASGVPVNVTLLFSADQYEAAADAYLAGVERRLARQLDPAIGSVASVFMSRWDVAVATRVPEELKDQLGLAVGLDTYRAYRQLMDSDRMQRLENSGGRVQRLLWASTSTKDPAASTRCTSTGSPRRSRSTPCRTPRCKPSTTTARSASPCPPTAVTATRSWPASARPASTCPSSPRGSRPTGPGNSWRPGTT
jgi:transaldolase